MKKLTAVILPFISLGIMFLIGIVLYNIALALPIPIDREDLKIVEQEYDDGVYTAVVSAKAGGLYCSGCDFRVDDGVLYITVTGNITKPDDDEVTFAFPCEGITTVKYEYKAKSDILFTVSELED